MQADSRKQRVRCPRRLCVLLSAEGGILTHFDTDREEFPAIATHGRDRIFQLVWRGDLSTLPGMDLPASVDGAMYQEVDVWRISGRTLDKPRPRRRRETAKIYQFPVRGAR